MLTKLLKYDLKYMIKNMSIFYILGIFFAITTRILFSLKQTIIINILGQISVGCMFSMLASTLFNTIIRSWVRFNDSIYKDESYLTHTLPVTKKEIYESRFLQSLLFTIVGFIIIIISLFIAYYTKERWLLLTNIFNSISNNINLNTSFIVISIILIFFLEIFNIIQNGFLGLILGNRKNDNKIFNSLLYGFISYMLSQGIVLLLTFFVGLFNNEVMNIFTSTNMLDNNTLKLLIIISFTTYTFIIILMNIICTKELNKGVNV